MSDNEWSSDEDTNEVPEQRELNMLESEEDSEYEEERQYILSLMKDRKSNFDMMSVTNEKPKEKKYKHKKQKVKELIDITPPEYHEPEKKKWVSKRMENKKEKDGKVTVTKRHFSPRLPIPTLATFKKKNEKTQLSDADFPSL
jgi:hypothetical protein